MSLVHSPRSSALAVAAACLALVLTACGGAAPVDDQLTGPAPVRWEGSWQTNRGVLLLQRRDGALIGSYHDQSEEGHVTGKVTCQQFDRELVVEWRDQEGGMDRGRARLVLSYDAQSFVGTWGVMQESSGGGTWNGDRVD